MKTVPFIFVLGILFFVSCSANSETGARFLAGEKHLIPSRIVFSTIKGEELFVWEQPGILQEISTLLQADYQFEKEHPPRRTLTGYHLNIRFTNSQEAGFLIYGTSGFPPVWRVAYPDPKNPSERLIKAVRVIPERLPESIRNQLERTSLLGEQ